MNKEIINQLEDISKLIEEYNNIINENGYKEFEKIMEKWAECTSSIKFDNILNKQIILEDSITATTFYIKAGEKDLFGIQTNDFINMRFFNEYTVDFKLLFPGIRSAILQYMPSVLDKYKKRIINNINEFKNCV